MAFCLRLARRCVSAAAHGGNAFLPKSCEGHSIQVRATLNQVRTKTDSNQGTRGTAAVVEGIATKALVEDLDWEHAERNRERDRKKLKLFFDGIDEDGNGGINRRELISALRNIRGVAECLDLPQEVRSEGGTRAVFESFFQRCDSDRNGEISWEEFLRAQKAIPEVKVDSGSRFRKSRRRQKAIPESFGRKVSIAMEYNPYHAAFQHLQNYPATVATCGAKVSVYAWHRHTPDINLISLDVQKLSKEC